MKTKLTLTIHKQALANAKRYSHITGKSISRIFEEIFEGEEPGNIISESQLAAVRLLSLLKDSESTKIKDDKNLLKAHIARKRAH